MVQGGAEQNCLAGGEMQCLAGKGAPCVATSSSVYFHALQSQYHQGSSKTE